MTLGNAIINMRAAINAIEHAIKSCNNATRLGDLEVAEKYCAEARKNILEWREEG